MNGIDPNKLFAIFDKSDEEIYQEVGMEELLNNPYVVIGSVVEGVENYFLTDQIYTNKNIKEYKEVRQKIKYKCFNRLYLKLNQLDIEEVQKTYFIGETYDIQESYNALDTLRDYFEQLEQYEKCALIVKYIDLLFTGVEFGN